MITLTTVFGLRDPFVGIMKGVYSASNTPAPGPLLARSCGFHQLRRWHGKKETVSIWV